CLANDSGAWRLFIERYMGLFVHVIKHTAHARSVRLVQQDVDDLCAEIFLALLANNFRILRKFREKSSLVTYLGVVSRRIVVHEITKQQKKDKLAFLSKAPSAKQSYRDQQQIEDKDEIQQMLKGLSYQDAEVIRLYHLQGKTYSEISDQLGVSENTIGPILSRAREKLRKSHGKVSS
ncbi:hypothetical protein MNBD_PLANCTO02-620, partial [hydrothermal vent metagenome]